jgi:hypothetical protein
VGEGREGSSWLGSRGLYLADTLSNEVAFNCGCMFCSRLTVGWEGHRKGSSAARKQGCKWVREEQRWARNWQGCKWASEGRAAVG